jgi:hypothetical protein
MTSTTIGRPVDYRGREISHRTIPMTTERSLALGRAAATLGISRATLITRLIDSGLAVIDPPDE